MTTPYRPARLTRLALAIPLAAAMACTSATDQTRVVDPFALEAPAPAPVYPEYRIAPGDSLRLTLLVGSGEESEYRIQIQDQVQVRFVTLPEYDTTQEVRPDGRITLPFLGDVRIAGSTPAEATRRIRDAYRGELRVPDVFLAVIQPNAGLAALTAAISTDDQEGRQVIVRPDGKITLPGLGEAAAAGATVAELSRSLNEVYREVFPHATVDVVLLESAGSTIAVLGEVGNPGAILASRPLMLFEALALAGGDTVNSELSTVVALRRAGDVVQARIIDMDAFFDGDEDAVMPMLQPGDIVYVPRTPLTNASTIARQIADITAYQAIMQGAALAVINNALD